MADIHVDKDRGTTLWPWVLGLVVLALLIWAFAANRTGMDEGTITTGQTSTTAVTPPTGTAATTGVTTERLARPAAVVDSDPVHRGAVPSDPRSGNAAAIPVALIVAQSGQYVQQTVTGTAQVAAIEGRGVWIEQEGERLFVLVNGVPAESAERPEAIAGLAPGQQVTLTGVVHDRASAQSLANDVDAEAQRIVDAEPAFLFVQADDIDAGTLTTAAADDDW
jgi:hypothetical protein